MAKELTGYIAVAGINLMGKEEYFAIYNDGYKYEKGDKVLVTGYRRGQILTIQNILTLDDMTHVHENEKITQEIVCKINPSAIDMTAYEDREKRRKELAKIQYKKHQLRQMMDNIIQSTKDDEKYEIFAETNSRFAKLLEEYKELSKEMEE
jgi:hypothetical protein|nr:MAG TPA_asm: hypothetical protein [Caudoviricetes sp.]